jgi:hypothetical protein
MLRWTTASEHYRSLRQDSNIMMVRRRAIWAGTDPDEAERLYRAAISKHSPQQHKAPVSKRDEY